ncbi:hypothetical protein [Niallia nealsonii]|nr:hypothetical protein [Niallia nealsonii]
MKESYLNKEDKDELLDEIRDSAREAKNKEKIDQLIDDIFDSEKDNQNK